MSFEVSIILQPAAAEPAPVPLTALELTTVQGVPCFPTGREWRFQQKEQSMRGREKKNLNLNCILKERLIKCDKASSCTTLQRL